MTDKEIQEIDMNWQELGRILSGKYKEDEGRVDEIAVRMT